jgi:asparagine synthase (glutamine-hydrolysing)
MCGIAGIWNLNGKPVIHRELDRFTDSMAHRGPDGRGVHFDHEASLALGHRRLAILDTTKAGLQPMSYGDGRYWITYNGEIYNFLELRAELAADGYRFHSDTDTEVVLAAYDKWGADCQLKFNGMWAFAIWDAKTRMLFLSRDRYGVKPLHYIHDGERFIFASELKAFLALSSIDVSFDLSMVAFNIERLGEAEGLEETLLQNVKRLPGGCCLVLTPRQAPQVSRWWNTLDHLETPPRSLDDQIEQFRELFLDAIRLRMRSDVPIGTSLSGGLDSGSVLCSMAHLRRSTSGGERSAADWQRAFVASYPGTVQDETPWARQVAEHVGVKTHYCEIQFAHLLEKLNDIVYHCESVLDVPIGPWQVYQAQRENGVVVSIDGHGSDEILAGYHHHVLWAMRDAAHALDYRTFAQLRQTLRNMRCNSPLPTFWRTLLARSPVADRTRLGRLSSLFYDSAAALRRRLKGSPEESWLAIEPFRPAPPSRDRGLEALEGRDSLFWGLYGDVHRAALPIDLRDYDRLSMAHGVEVRTPFLDWRLIRCALSLPTTSKLKHGYTKYILRQAMRGILPDDIRLRSVKTGFSNPMSSWILGGANRYILDVVRSQKFKQSPVWHGQSLALAVERGLKTDDQASFEKAWLYVVAFQLMESFDRKKTEGRLASRRFA